MQSKKIRIIGGVWRSRLIKVIDAPGLRPTTDRVRETLFNWLGQNLAGLRCLDAFAGAGALGFEAVSRGASTVTLIERDKTAFATLRANLSDLQSFPVEASIDLVHGDGVGFLKRQANTSWDLVFLDPPFDDRLALDSSIQEAGRVCDGSNGGQIYIETAAGCDLAALNSLIPQWECCKEMTAGQVKALLFQLRRD
ncbi:MAG: rRNA ((966)-N(2))-methyltransferase RsmD [Pseudomonadota bacterium]